MQKVEILDFKSFLKKDKIHKELSKYLAYLTIKSLQCLGLCKFEIIPLENLRKNLIFLKEEISSKKKVNLSSIKELESQLDYYIKDITGNILKINIEPENNSNLDSKIILEWLNFIILLLSEISQINTFSIVDFINESYDFILSRDYKEKGEFYTPSVICNYIIQKTLIDDLDNAIYKIKEFIEAGEKEQINALTQINSLKIMDPSCGVGNFLIEIVRHIVLYMKTLLLNVPIENKKKLFQDVILLIFNQIYGLDLDENAIIISRYNILLIILENSLEDTKIIKFEDLEYFVKKLSDILLNNIKVNDFLLSDEFQNQKFNYIVGNPPYISIKNISSIYKEKLRNKFKNAVKQFDLYSLFIEQCYNYLDQKGICGLIIPDSFLGRSHFTSIRNYLLENTLILQIDQIKGVFKDPSVSNVIVIFKKVDSRKECLSNMIKLSKYKDLKNFVCNTKDSIQLAQNYFLSQNNYQIQFIKPEFEEILNKMKDKNILLGSIAEIHRGEELGKNSPLIHKQFKESSQKILIGKDIQRFNIHFNGNYILKQDIQKKNYFSIYFNPKIVIRQLGDKINAAFDEKGEYVTIQTVYNLKILDLRYNYLIILGIINSELLHFYYTLKFKDKQLFSRILLENLKNLPIPKPTSALNEQIDEITSRIIYLKNKNLNSKNEEEMLDALIYDLYEIPKPMRLLIKKYLENV